MKSTTITEGAFMVLIEQDKTGTEEMPFTWVLFLHDEVLDLGHNYTHSDAVEDAEAELQEFIDTEILGIETEHFS